MAYTTILLAVMFMLNLLTNNNVYAQCDQNKPTEPTQKVTYTASQGQLINLADSHNGGDIITAPRMELANVNNPVNEKELKKIPFYKGEEVVMGFKNGQSVLIEKVTWWIGGAADTNAKTIEIFVSNDSATSGFRSIGKMNLQNTRILKSPYQEFSFTPVKARYVKLKIVESIYYGYGYFDGFQVFGRLIK